MDWIAFWRLSGSRQVGMGLGNIQISEIYAYMRMFEIDSLNERATLLERIQFMDNVYMEYQAEKTKEEKRKKARTAKKSPGR